MRHPFLVLSAFALAGAASAASAAPAAAATADAASAAASIGTPAAPPAPAASRPRAAFTGPDFSGVYDCKGEDDHEGPYTGTVTLERVASQSIGGHGAYRFLLDVPGYGRYPGHAAAHGMQMAIHFALTDPGTKDYGTGIATFRKVKAAGGGKWSFRKYYYEPEFKGGNCGFEDCVQR